MVGRVDGARHELMRRVMVIALLAATATSSACSRHDASASDAAVPDTLYTAEESLRRFRAPLTRVESLSPSFTTKEDVARAFVSAVTAQDVRGLALTLLSPAEFAWLYYPENPISQPPYELPAGIAWFELHGSSLSGARRALSAYGGRHVTFRELECPAPAVVQGANRLWNRCTVTLVFQNGRTETARMFGSILERAGKYKLVTAANDL